MAENNYTDYLILPHLRVQNANAISGPFTHGFPSITAFIGLMWALERKCKCEHSDILTQISFKKVGVISHQTQELIAGEGYGPKVFNQLRRPVRKTGKSTPMQEEGRMHLEFSLIFGLKITSYLSEQERAQTAQKILDIVENIRLAGGTFLPSVFPGAVFFYRRQPRLVAREVFEEKWYREKHYLLPGFALIEREDLLEKRLEKLKKERLKGDPEPTRLEAFLSLCAWNYKAEKTEEGKVEWQHDRPKGFGWIVPISVGYGAIGPLHEAGSVEAARDKTVSFQAVESLQSIGEWRSPHRFESVEDFLWGVISDPEAGIYRCQNFGKAEIFPLEDDDEESA